MRIHGCPARGWRIRNDTRRGGKTLARSATCRPYAQVADSDREARFHDEAALARRQLDAAAGGNAEVGRSQVGAEVGLHLFTRTPIAWPLLLLLTGVPVLISVNDIVFGPL